MPDKTFSVYRIDDALDGTFFLIDFGDGVKAMTITHGGENDDFMVNFSSPFAVWEQRAHEFGLPVCIGKGVREARMPLDNGLTIHFRLSHEFDDWGETEYLLINATDADNFAVGHFRYPFRPPNVGVKWLGGFHISYFNSNVLQSFKKLIDILDKWSSK